MEEEGETAYYPEWGGELLPNGYLRVKTAWRGPDGEVCDGEEYITPDDPRYPALLERWQNREEYRQQFAAEVRRARELRRAAAKARRANGNDPSTTP
jgi:hypothetical protein